MPDLLLPESEAIVSKYPNLRAEVRYIEGFFHDLSWQRFEYGYMLDKLPSVSESKIEKIISAYEERGLLERQDIFSCPLDEEILSENPEDAPFECRECGQQYDLTSCEQTTLYHFMRQIKGIMKTPRIFISYSHDDEEEFGWVEKFRKMFAPDIRNEDLILWDDTQINTGEHWEEKIEQAILKADVAVLIVSPNFLDSPFIASKEMPAIFREAKERGLIIFPIMADACRFEKTELGKIQAANNPENPLIKIDNRDFNTELKKITEKLDRLIQERK